MLFCDSAFPGAAGAGSKERLVVADGGHGGAAAGRQPGVQGRLRAEQPAENAAQVRMRLWIRVVIVSVSVTSISISLQLLPMYKKEEE